jgi:HK97 family phage major capsid protein
MKFDELPEEQRTGAALVADKVKAAVLADLNAAVKTEAKAAGFLDAETVKKLVEAEIAQHKAEIAPKPTLKLDPKAYLTAKIIESAHNNGLIPKVSTDVGDTYKRLMDGLEEKAAFDITSAGAGLELRPQAWFDGVTAPLIAAAPFLARTARVPVTSNVINFPFMTDEAHTSTRNAKAGTGATEVPDSGAGTTSNTQVTLSWVSRGFAIPDDLLKFGLVNLIDLYARRAVQWIGLDIEGEHLEGTNSWWAATSVLSRASKTGTYDTALSVYKNFAKAADVLDAQYQAGNFGLTMAQRVRRSLLMATTLDGAPLFPLGVNGNVFGGQTGSFVGIPYYISPKPATTDNKSNVYVGDPANYTTLIGEEINVKTNPFQYMRQHATWVQIDVLAAGHLIDPASIGVYKDWPV